MPKMIGIAITAILGTILGYGICAMMVIAKEYDEAMARDMANIMKEYDEAMARDMANIMMKSRNKL